MRIASDITKLVGGTPLVRLNGSCPVCLTRPPRFFNPPIRRSHRRLQIETLEKAGRIQAGKTVLVEPTSGNTGIALAFVAAAKGYRLILTMPETMSIERRKVLKLLGAEVVLTPGPLGMKGAIAKASEIVAEHGPNAVIPQQFENPANPAIHEATTAVELWNDTEGTLDIFWPALERGNGRRPSRPRRPG
jgi:cysteine synthase A